MYILSIHTHPQYSRDLRAHARRPLRLSTSSQSSENTPKTSCVKLRELKLKRESEQTRARTHKLGRPTPALEHPTDDKFCWSGGGNSHLLSKPSFIFSM